MTGREQETGTVRVDLPNEALRDLIRDKQLGISHVYNALSTITADLNKDGFFPKVQEVLPPVIDGILLNPDGTPAHGVTVEAVAPKYTAAELAANNALAGASWPVPHDTTDARGGFKLNLPTVPVPVNGLRLRATGGNGSTELELKRVLVTEGRLGTLALANTITPKAESIVARLRDVQSDILATSGEDVSQRPDEFASPAPKVTLGEGDCAKFFRSNSGVIDRFSYSVLIRLVEPQMNQWQPLFRIGVGDNRFVPFPVPPSADSFWHVTGAANAIKQLDGLGTLVLVNRTPIDRPIDVSEFHRQTEEEAVFLPKASTLGLGYVVKMHQTWIPAGLSLGDLVYSLPLAPGEQQRIAIEERTQTVSERAIETFSQDEFQTFRETQDSSTHAAFSSAFTEASRGGSRIDSSSHTESGAAEVSSGIVGAIFGGGGASGGFSDSSSSGSTSSWQNTSRDFTSNSAQDMHAALGRVAAASRRGSQTSIRVASASEQTHITTRIVTNHNKNHALTMQWWQVLRHFSVSSEVDDVQLVCFLPLELIQFLPSGQPFSLDAMPTSRSTLLARYAMVLRYYDVLIPFFRRNAEYAYGMRQLRDFAANPETKPAATNLQQDVVHFVVKGTFMPFEELFVTIISKSGARVGPFKLTATSPITTADLTPEKYSTRQELLGHLKDRRINGTDAALAAEIPLPNWMARSDVARFDVSRRFISLSYRLKPVLPALAGLGITGVSGIIESIINAQQQQVVSLPPSELEQELGGPIVHSAEASLLGVPATPPAQGNVNFIAANNLPVEQMGGTLPIPAVRIAAVLSFTDLLRIEAVFHHIVRNTVFYSKAIWAALSDEERAIMLERFTIGVPSGGVTNADQEVPLLNCVVNKVLGFFGNAAIMPFAIPPQVAASMKVTSRDIQDALLRFHRQAFQPPRSSISLPAHGTLGEAVLGSCSSAEKIDLTRFWNWQDSPTEQADAIPASVFQPPQALPAPTSGAGAGGGAATPGSIISINNGTPAPQSTALLEALVKQAPDLAKELNLTGLDTLQKQLAADTQSASEGRKEALDSVTQIQLQAMKSAESVVKSVADAVGKAAPAAAGAPPA